MPRSKSKQVWSHEAQASPRMSPHDVYEAGSRDVPNGGGNSVGDRLEKLAQRLPNFDRLIREMEQEYASTKSEINLLRQEMSNNSVHQNTLDRLKQDFDSKLCKAKDQIEHLGEERNAFMESSQKYEADLKQKDKDITKLCEKMQKLEVENNDLKSRLSQVMGNKAIHNNPQVVDLSDKNRPSKLAERYSELYDNEWMDVYEVVSRQTAEEKKVIQTLLQILLFVNDYCKNCWDDYDIKLQREITLGNNIEVPGFVIKQLKDCCKNMAPELVDHVYKGLSDRSTTVAFGHVIRSSDCVGFIRGCVEVCWLMSAQDPPVVLGTNYTTNDKLDTAIFRAYTKSGSTLDYMVWPPLYLHDGGPVLCKGVAQAQVEDKRRGREESTPAPTSTGVSKGDSMFDKTVHEATIIQVHKQRGTTHTDGRNTASSDMSSDPGATQKNYQHDSVKTSQKEDIREKRVSSQQASPAKTEWKYRVPSQSEWHAFMGVVNGKYKDVVVRNHIGEEAFSLCWEYFQFLRSQKN